VQETEQWRRALLARAGDPARAQAAR